MLSRFRILELKYMCLQYFEMKRRLLILESKNLPGRDFLKNNADFFYESRMDEILYLKNRIDAIEKAGRLCDEQIGGYIFTAATLGRSFTYMKMKIGLPCERDMYYDRKRKFFDCLDKIVN